LSSRDVCISATTGPGMSSDTCFPDSQILSDADLFRFQFPVHHNSLSTQPFKHSPRFQLSGISCSPRVAPTLQLYIRRRKTTSKTRLMRQWRSISLSMFNPTLTSMRGAESTAKQQHRPRLPRIPISQVYILSAHTYQFLQRNTMFKSIDFSTSGRFWITTTYQLGNLAHWYDRE